MSAMKKVEVYTQPFCGYCSRAARLLSEKGVDFEEIDVMLHPARRAEMIARADGRSTTPQIFIDGRGVGGSDDLAALERSGDLDRLLADGG
jgi:glutaredoxin 3